MDLMSETPSIDAARWKLLGELGIKHRGLRALEERLDAHFAPDGTRRPERPFGVAQGRPRWRPDARGRRR